jgi:hypothetical protein
MNQFTQNFEAKGSDGQAYELFVYENVVEAGTRGNPGGTLRGLKEIRTKDGGGVNRVSKGVYQLGDITLRSDAPDAP